MYQDEQTVRLSSAFADTSWPSSLLVRFQRLVTARLVALLAAAFGSLFLFLEAQAVGDVEFNDPMISSGLLLYSPILTTAATTVPFMWTSAAIEGRDEKLILLARDDAALYLASEGREQGAYLAAALALLREQGAAQGDQELAEWILMTAAK